MSCVAHCGATGVMRLNALNRECACLPLDRERLVADIVAEAAAVGVFDDNEVRKLHAALRSRTHLFAATPVFLCRHDLLSMLDTVGAIEALTRLDGYRHWAGQIPDVRTPGLIMGYDFHVGDAGPQLIEVNTNAGGAFIAALLATAAQHQTAPCVGQLLAPTVEAADMASLFQAEWRAASVAPLQRVGIVDTAIEEQYLWPDMALAQGLLRGAGIDCDLLTPEALDAQDGRLTAGGERLDLLYNRLTDFSLVQPEHATLARAWRTGAGQGDAVISPAPEHHALYANKRNLTAFGDLQRLAQWGLPLKQRSQLQATVPVTELVTRDNADALWRRRRALFFKPVAGFGSRATYRGAKLTRRVWNEILAADYVAQQLVPPPQRQVGETQGAGLKFDVRVYVHAGQPLSVAARVYAGQTTNFRTPGGGFAPIVELA